MLSTELSRLQVDKVLWAVSHKGPLQASGSWPSTSVPQRRKKLQQPEPSLSVGVKAQSSGRRGSERPHRASFSFTPIYCLLTTPPCASVKWRHLPTQGHDL